MKDVAKRWRLAGRAERASPEPRRSLHVQRVRGRTALRGWSGLSPGSPLSASHATRQPASIRRAAASYSDAARTQAVLHHHTGDAASLASALGGEAVDVRASSGAPADPPRDPSAGCPFRARQPAVGLSTHCRRTERRWHGGLGDDGPHLASGSGSRPRRHARWDDLARVRASAPAKHARGRLLHRRDDVAATAVCALLHRTRQPPCAHRGLHAESKRAVGDTTGPATNVDARRPPRVVPLSEIHRQF